jgi:4-diphosphocytidyl-2-C-methyl-D-erythritol kinase
MKREMTLESPAKVNLYLAVLGRRDDGYHDIETLFQTVSLADTITVRVDDSGGGKIRVRSSDAGLPADEENLAGRAARAMLDEAARTRGAGAPAGAASTGVARAGIDIAIEKRIPVGAGLGGGSGDAATVLVALNALLDLHLAAERLEQIGATIGSDVPFLVRGGTAIGRGRGETLERCPPLAPVEILLAKPDVSVSTRWAYETLGAPLTAVQTLSIVGSRRGALEIREVLGSLWNAFEDAVTRRHPIIREIRETMVATGALGVLMTGTGPTVVGLYAEPAQLRETESSLRSRSIWVARATPVGERAADPREV